MLFHLLYPAREIQPNPARIFSETWNLGTYPNGGSRISDAKTNKANCLQNSPIQKHQLCLSIDLSQVVGPAIGKSREGG